MSDSSRNNKAFVFKVGIGLFVCCALGLIGFIVVRAIQGQANADPVDPNRTKEIEITSGSSGGEDSQASSPEQEEKSILLRFLTSKEDDTPESTIDPLIDFAKERLTWLQENVDDYTTTLVKRERIGNKLQDEQFMTCKIRRSHENEAGEKVPFSVYLSFTDPSSVRGREVIWVEDRNDNRLIAHEGGWKNIKTLRLQPTNPLANFGNRYSITEIGLDNLLTRLIEIGTAERIRSSPTIEIKAGQQINDRACTRVEIKFEPGEKELEFSKTILYLDDESGLPIRYSAFGWPDNGDEELPLLESYTYLDLKLNTGLDETDFSPENPDYNYR